MCVCIPVWVHMHPIACIPQGVCVEERGGQRTASGAIWEKVFLSFAVLYARPPALDASGESPVSSHLVGALGLLMPSPCSVICVSKLLEDSSPGPHTYRQALYPLSHLPSSMGYFKRLRLLWVFNIQKDNTDLVTKCIISSLLFPSLKASFYIVITQTFAFWT